MKENFEKVIISILYTVVFYFVYVYYLYPVFGYAGYTYIHRSFIYLLPSLFFAVIPVFIISNHVRVSILFVTAIYLLTYVPTIVMIPIRLTVPQVDQFALQFIYFIGMTIVAFSTRGNVKVIRLKKFVDGDKILMSLTLLFVGYLVFVYAGNISFVSFARVYEQRFKTNEIGTVASGYIIMILSNVFCPFLVVNGVLRKKISRFIVGAGGVILIYGITAAKMTLLSLFVMLVFSFIKLGRKNIFKRLTLLLSVLSIIVIAMPSPNEIIRWGKSLLFMRTLSTGGWTNLSYFETFSSLPKTYYSHIGIINKLLGIYPFDGLSLGQVVGLKYSGTSDANFNAGFWASDGIAALGTVGVVVISIIVFFFLKLLDKLSLKLEKNSLFVFLVPFIMTFLNIPFGTALLSGGGFLIMAILFLGLLPQNTGDKNVLSNNYYAGEV